MKCMKKKKGAKGAKSKAPMLDGNPTPTVQQVLAQKKSVCKFASAIAQLKLHRVKKNRPNIPKCGTLKNAEYMTGRIYTKHQGMPRLRVYARKGDTHEQRFSYDPDDKDSRDEAWHMACSVMEMDPRKPKADT